MLAYQICKGSDLQNLLKYGASVKLKVGGGADATGRNLGKSFRFQTAQLTGVVTLARAWHCIGGTVRRRHAWAIHLLTHPQHKPPVVSKNYIDTASAFASASELIEQIHGCSHRVNCILEAIDPEQFTAMKKLNEAAQTIPYVKALSAIDCLLFEGRHIIFNRQTPLHTDDLDPWTGWAILVAFGQFTKGAMHIPRLNLRLRFQPGDIIAMRGRILPHEIEAWSGGQRVSVVHFTHKSLWDWFGIHCP